MLKEEPFLIDMLWSLTKLVTSNTSQLKQCCPNKINIKLCLVILICLNLVFWDLNMDIPLQIQTVLHFGRHNLVILLTKLKLLLIISLCLEKASGESIQG